MKKEVLDKIHLFSLFCILLGGIGWKGHPTSPNPSFFLGGVLFDLGFGRFRVRWGPKGPSSPNPPFFVCFWVCWGAAKKRPFSYSFRGFGSFSVKCPFFNCLIFFGSSSSPFKLRSFLFSFFLSSPFCQYLFLLLPFPSLCFASFFLKPFPQHAVFQTQIAFIWGLFSYYFVFLASRRCSF